MQMPVCSQRGSWSAILQVPCLSLTRLSLLPPQAWPCLSVRLQQGSWKYHRRRRQPVQHTGAACASLPSTTWLFSAGTLYCVPLFLLVSSCCCAPARRRALLCQSLSSINAADSVSIARASQLSIRVSRVTHPEHGLQMLLLPRWSITYRLMKGYAVFLPLSAVYIVLLARSWTPDMLQLMMPGSLDAGLSGQPAHDVPNLCISGPHRHQPVATMSMTTVQHGPGQAGVLQVASVRSSSPPWKASQLCSAASPLQRRSGCTS